MRRIFVAGIGTDVGKTVAAAAVTEALGADYWKPVQAGSLECTDSDTVVSLLSNRESRVHPEGVRLKMPASPHAAAAAEGIAIRVCDFTPPETKNALVIEGAGGLLVPLNDRELVIDLISHLKAEVVLVSKFYLGSINHTLLSLEALRLRGIPILGIVFNGEPNRESQAAILAHSQAPFLGQIGWERRVDREMIARYAAKLLPYIKG